MLDYNTCNTNMCTCMSTSNIHAYCGMHQIQISRNNQLRRVLYY